MLAVPSIDELSDNVLLIDYVPCAGEKEGEDSSMLHQYYPCGA